MSKMSSKNERHKMSSRRPWEGGLPGHPWCPKRLGTRCFIDFGSNIGSMLGARERQQKYEKVLYRRQKSRFWRFPGGSPNNAQKGPPKVPGPKISLFPFHFSIDSGGPQMTTTSSPKQPPEAPNRCFIFGAMSAPILTIWGGPKWLQKAP